MSGRPQIHVRNAQRKLRIDLGALQEFATCAVEHCFRLPKNSARVAGGLSEVSVVLVSDRRISALHKKFMDNANATDVLTFQHGEIVVSVETAQENAARFGTAFEDEIRLYIIHGLLHLLGFDDTTTAQARRMELTQTQVLRATQHPNDR